jgi:iron-sulfur cluster assembly accessory protein
MGERTRLGGAPARNLRVRGSYKRLIRRGLCPLNLTLGAAMQTESAVAVNTEAPASPVLLSELAATEVRRYIEEQGAAETAGLRVGVLPGGCSGFQYGLNIEDEPGDDDMTFESQGIRLFVDPFSLQYLQGTEIDFVSTFQGSGFTFNNPNASGGCGCGSSFTA